MSLGLGATSLVDEYADWHDHPATARGFSLIEWARAGLVGEDYTDLWVSPRDGSEPKRCPWLRKLARSDLYKCRIHEVRPPVCRNFPVDAEQAIRFGCPMIEEADIGRPMEALDRELDSILGRG